MQLSGAPRLPVHWIRSLQKVRSNRNAFSGTSHLEWEAKSHAFYEISGMAILAPILF